MSDKDKAIRRLKKLMALTSSSNASEASVALARAQKLADVHRDSNNAQNSGYREGRQASLHHPINGQEQAKLGISS